MRTGLHRGHAAVADAAYMRSGSLAKGTAVARLLALREKHQSSIARIKSMPIGPKRHALLKQADEAARLIREAEKKAGRK